MMPRPWPPGPQKAAWMRHRALLVFTAGTLLATLVPLAGGYDPRILGAFAIYFVWITLAESWNLVGGFAGLLNLGLVAFFGLGAIVGGAELQVGLPLPGVLLASGMAGAGLAALLIPTFRLRTFYFAMGSFVVPYMVKPLVEAFGGNAAFHVPLGRILAPVQLYYAGLGLVAFSVFGVYFLMKSKVGLALRSLGNDEVASASVGVNVRLYKSTALIASGILASVAGLYYVQITGTADTTIFQNLGFSLLPVFMVIIGGTGTFEGPIVGALVFSALNYYVTSQFPGSTIDTFVLSIAIIAVALFRPRGIASRSAP